LEEGQKSSTISNSKDHHTTTTGSAAVLGRMDDNAGAGHMAAEVGKLSAEALAKRAARASRREQEESGQDKHGHPQDKDNKGEDEDMWTNEYAFSSFSLKVQEEFGGEACVGGTQWPGTSPLVCLWRAGARQVQ